MIGRTNAGGGGSGAMPLDIVVVGGSTAPVSPVENTYWVDTTDTITSWTLAVEAPTQPSEGDVWIPQSTHTSVFYTVQTDQGGFDIGMMPAFQYLSGEWVSRDSQYYKNSAWHSFYLYLCQNDTMIITPSISKTGGTFVQNGNVLKTTSKSKDGGWYWSHDVFAGYTTVHVTATSETKNARIRIGSFSAIGSTGPVSVYDTYISDNGLSLIEIDRDIPLSTSDSAIYLAINANAGNGAAENWTFTLHDMYLIP